MTHLRETLHQTRPALGSRSARLVSQPAGRAARVGWRTLRTKARALGLPALLCLVLPACTTTPHPPDAKAKTISSFDVGLGRNAKAEVPAGVLRLERTPTDQVLQIYQELSGRTVIRPAALPAPQITLRNEGPMTRVRALQLLDTVLAENGIAMVLLGDDAVQAVPVAQVGMTPAPEINLPWQLLPESGSYLVRKVHLKKRRPSELLPALVGFGKSPNCVLPIDSAGLLILRDFSANVRQMLRLIDELDAK